MVQRSVTDPPKEWFTEKELCDYCRITPKLLRAMIRDGRAPRPRQLTKRSKLWSWEAAVWLFQGLGNGWLKAPKQSNTGPMESKK